MRSQNPPHPAPGGRPRGPQVPPRRPRHQAGAGRGGPPLPRGLSRGPQGRGAPWGTSTPPWPGPRPPLPPSRTSPSWGPPAGPGPLALAKGAYLFHPDLAREVAATPWGSSRGAPPPPPRARPPLSSPRGSPPGPSCGAPTPSWSGIPGEAWGAPHLELRFLAYVQGEGASAPPPWPWTLDAAHLEEAVEKTSPAPLREGWGFAARALQEERPHLEREYGGVLRELLPHPLPLPGRPPTWAASARGPPAPWSG